MLDNFFFDYYLKFTGMKWSTVWRPNTPDDSLTLGLIMMMLLIDTFLYLVIALYFEAIFPGEYGVPLPWYFPVSPSYWRARHKTFREYYF